MLRFDVYDETGACTARAVPFSELGDELDIEEITQAIQTDGKYCGGGGAAPYFELRTPDKHAVYQAALAAESAWEEALKARGLGRWDRGANGSGGDVELLRLYAARIDANEKLQVFAQ